MYFLPQIGSDIHQRIKREARYTATQQIVNAWLGDTASLRSLGLCPVAAVDEGGDLTHQLGASGHIGGFRWRFCDGIPDIGKAGFVGHGKPRLLVLAGEQFSKAHASNFQIAFCGGLGFLLEQMQDIDGIGESGGVDNPISARFIPYTDFFNALANGGHRFEIAGLFAALDAVQLITNILFGISWQITQPPERVSQEEKLLRYKLYPYQYN